MARTLGKQDERKVDGQIYPQHRGINEAGPLAHPDFYKSRVLKRILGQDAEGGNTGMPVLGLHAPRSLVYLV